MHVVVDDPLSEELIHEKLTKSIRANYLGLEPTSLVFAHISITTIALVMLPHVNNLGMTLWALSQSVIILTGSRLVRRAAPERFIKTAIAAAAVAGAWWALLPVFALPDSPSWQTMQGLVLIALLMGTLGNTTESRGLHIASTVPLAIIGSVVFALKASGAAVWVGAAFATCLPYTLIAGAMLRQVQTDLFESSLRNENFAASLRSEGDRLQIANDQLETANGHLDQLARRDTLTGLYNRAGFTQLLNQAVRQNPGKVAVCYLDLDGFKRVNDAFGHRFGDLVLRSASHRISGVLTEGEVLGRQGGDELTLFSVVDDVAGANDLGDRILSVFQDPFTIEDQQIEIRVSAGVAWIPEPTSSDDLMRFADTALYEAKDRGRNQFALFDQHMRHELRLRARLQADLSSAFENHEITAYLQPIVEVKTGRIATAEALARWEHPTGVRVAGQFIDTARDMGMLDRINNTVVQEVLQFQRATHASGHATCPINVNVSPMHLELMLNRLLEEPVTAPIIIEITEDGIFADLDRARELLQRARDAGIEVLLDDFGVGFSSLSIATELPINGFKIDRGFVASLAGNPSALAAVQAIIQLAETMGLHVVAEGVETHEQLQLLRELGVEYAQGYLFSKAVPMSTFAGWLHDDFRFDVADALSVV